MSEKHTPGPWTVHKPGDYSPTITDFIITGPKSPDPVTQARYIDLATVTADFGGNPLWDWPTKEECQANARLIAAAPELLEVCKKALNGLIDISGQAYNLTDQHIINQLQAAITQATGPAGESE